jgi:amino acid adenylation domain-containing protein
MFYSNILSPVLEAINNFGDCNAFYIQDKYYSYKEFSKYISMIRGAIKLKISNHHIIGLVVHDDIETYASIFAIWLEGYAYVPLHPAQPNERNIEIINQINTNLILDSKAKIENVSCQIITCSQLSLKKIDLKPKKTSDESLAYILFTSGSTGKPKGVQISRKNLGSFMKSFWETGIKLDNQDRCLQCFDLTFDVSIQSFLVPLTRGACTYTVPLDQIKYSYVYGLLEDHMLTFGALAPSIIRYLRPYFKEINLPSLRYIILTAEASPLDLVIDFSNCIPNAEIYDFYGPTEATIYCTYNKFSRDNNNKHLNGMLSIGKPMNGISAIILDDYDTILDKGAQGELCIAGNQLTIGYWNDSVKNSESFFEIIDSHSKIRYYRTGDSCSIDDEGYLMLAGRKDHQVKIQGFRVELSEIEYHARNFIPGVNAVALTFLNQININEIVLFIESQFINDKDLIKYLKRKMPSFMIPSKVIPLKQFPLTTSGKVDRVLLKNKYIN